MQGANGVEDDLGYVLLEHAALSGEGAGGGIFGAVRSCGGGLVIEIGCGDWASTGTCEGGGGEGEG